MRHILLPDDFSDNAGNAIDYAVHLFGTKDVKYHLFYTYVIPVVTSELAYTPVANFEKEGEEKIKQAAEKVRGIYPEIDIEAQLEFGEIPAAINRILGKIDIDYIVMGTKGSSGMKEMLYGSNTYDVVDNTITPVLIVPKDCSYSPLKKVVIASDLKPFKDKAVMNPLKKIAAPSNSQITILNMKESADTFTVNEQINYFDEQFEGFDVNLCFDDSKNVAEGINNYTKEYGTDLLVCIKRKKNFLQDIFTKSLTKEMTFHSQIPLLILHE